MYADQHEGSSAAVNGMPWTTALLAAVVVAGCRGAEDKAPEFPQPSAEESRAFAPRFEQARPHLADCQRKEPTLPPMPRPPDRPIVLSCAEPLLEVHGKVLVWDRRERVLSPVHLMIDAAHRAAPGDTEVTVFVITKVDEEWGGTYTPLLGPGPDSLDEPGRDAYVRLVHISAVALPEGRPLGEVIVGVEPPGSKRDDEPGMSPIEPDVRDFVHHCIRQEALRYRVTIGPGGVQQVTGPHPPLGP